MKRSGFTLIELVVTLAVAALVVATAPAALSRAHETMEYRATVRQMLAALKGTRMTAMRDGRDTAFELHLAEGRFGTEGHASRAIPERIAIHMVLAEREIEPGEVGRIRFYPDGSSTGGSIHIERASGGGVRLTVDWLLGRVSQSSIETGL